MAGFEKYIKTLLFLLPFISAGFPAGAQKFLDEYKKPMPEISLLPPEEFAQKTTEYKEAPLGDKALAYSIRIPKNWEKSKDAGVGSVNTAVSTKVLVELSRFYGPSSMDVRSYVTVQALNLDYDLTAEQWLMQYLLANAYTLQGIKTYDNSKVEAFFVNVQRDITYVVRAVAVRNGKRIILTQYFVSADYWEQEKQMQTQVVSSFKLDNTVTEDVEPMLKYHFLDIAEVSYPASWEFHFDQLTSVDRLKVQMYNIASEEYKNRKRFKTLNGKIDLSLVSYYAVDSLTQEMLAFKDQLRKDGLLVQKLVETVNDVERNKNMKGRPVEVYEVIETDNSLLNYELWVEVMQAGDYYYFLSLLTVSRDEDYAIWSRNIQTFKKVLSSIIPQQGSLVGQ